MLEAFVHQGLYNFTRLLRYDSSSTTSCGIAQSGTDSNLSMRHCAPLRGTGSGRYFEEYWFSASASLAISALSELIPAPNSIMVDNSAFEWPETFSRGHREHAIDDFE